ncbi:MAG: NrsF family protein [Devosia sp.]
MKTDDLIGALAADSDRQHIPPQPTLWLALLASVLVAGAMLLATIGVRPDIASAATSIRFLFKFVFTITVAATAFALVRRSLYPETSGQLPWPVLLAGPALLAVGVALELWVLPTDAWSMSATGKNGFYCLTVVPALGIVPLGLAIWALRRGAPTRPGLAGFCAGLLAGGIAATFYAANCTDDSPLFVATWYPIAIGGLGFLGAWLGRLAIRW